MGVEGWVALPLLLVGLFFFAAGTAALVRFPDLLTRLHGLTKADMLGLGWIVLGLLPLSRSFLEAAKMIFTWLLVLVAGAAVAQLFAASEARRERRGR